MVMILPSGCTAYGGGVDEFVQTDHVIGDVTEPGVAGPGPNGGVVVRPAVFDEFNAMAGGLAHERSSPGHP